MGDDAESATKMEAKAPPMWRSGRLSYDAWRFEVELWDEWTAIPKNKRGRLVMVALPIDDPSGAREKIRLAIQNGDIKISDDNGVQTILKELDKSFKKDDLSTVCEAWSSFIGYRRTVESMSEYITIYERKVSEMKKVKISLPAVVLGMQLLNGAVLDKNERQIVLTAVDYARGDELFSQMKTALRKFHGETPVDKEKRSLLSDNVVIKEESINVASDTEVMAVRSFRGGSRGGFRNYRGQYGGNFRGRGFRTLNGRGRGGFRGGGQGPNNGDASGNLPTKRRVNPRDFSGNIMRCNVCESIRHFQGDCPDAWENLNRNSEANEVEDVKEVHVSDYSFEDKQVLICEAFNAAVLDSACSKTVAGKAWKDAYIESLSPYERSQVKTFPGGTRFKFGGEAKRESLERVQLPATIVGEKTFITTDIVDSDIPLLLSKPDMKRFGVKLDLENDTANIFGKRVELETTSSGHYCLPLKECIIPVEGVYLAVGDKHPDEKKKVIQKLHRQFAHPSATSLKALLKSADVLDKESEEKITEITENCTICKRYKKTPSRPAVCLPLATRFNETVAMDLKEFKPGIYFLHVIDLYTRFSLAKVIKRKLPSVIVDNVILMWIASGLGPPEKFLTDNGGEFCNEIYKEMAEQFNVQTCTTGAQSPWSNGICERNHAVTDAAVCRMLEDDPHMSVETALAWAINAKNAMFNHNGFSPYQLVYGQTPNLPSVLSSKLPALESKVNSETVAKHLNTLHAARKAFIKAESSERIKRALRCQVRAVEENFDHGDRVYYKRDDSNRWRGPGKIIGQDGKVVFVRHGDQLVRVSTCRLVKVGQEFDNTDKLPPTFQESQKTLIPNRRLAVGENEDLEDVLVELDNYGHSDEISGRKNETANLEVDVKQEILGKDLDEQNTCSLDGSKNMEEKVGLSAKKVMPNKGDKIRYHLLEDGWAEATVIGRGGKATGRNKYYYNVQNRCEGKQIGINLDQIEFEKINDFENGSFNEENESVNMACMPNEGQENEKVIQAKENELENWSNFRVFEEVEDKGQKTLSTRWVINEKILPDGTKGIKARLVVRGFEEEQEIQSDSPTAAKSTLRVFFAVAANQMWKCQTIDIKAAFLQGKEIEREVYLRPPSEVKIPGYIWKLKKVAYGLDDAARNWFLSVGEFLRGLNCKQSFLDKALFRWYSGEQLQGIFLMHVDDFLFAGTELFKRKVIEPLCQYFKVGKQQEGVFRYIGLDMSNSEKGLFIQQQSYINEIVPMEISTKRKRDRQAFLNEEETKKFRGVVGQLNWISSQTRPDVTYDMLSLSTVTKHPQVQHIIEANKAIQKAKSKKSGILYHRLGKFEDLSLEVYTDAAWANLPDGHSSTGGYLILLVAITSSGKLCVPLDWSSHKIQRTVHSTLAAESLAMLEGVDNAIYLGSMLTELYMDNYKFNKIPIFVGTDNKSLQENLYSTKQVKEKRLRVTMAELQEMLHRGDLKNVAWIPSRVLLADLLTKRGVCSDSVLECFNSGFLDKIMFSA